MKVSDRSWLNSLAKKITPSIGRWILSTKAASFIDLSIDYLNILIGKGSGTGWDRTEVQAPASVIKSKDPVIIDGGANIGTWTTELMKIIGTNGRWILVEPEEWCIQKLRLIPSVEIIDKAIGESDGEAVLHTPELGSGFASLCTRNDTFIPKGDVISKTVPMISIDSIIRDRNIKEVSFLKLDIEGYELFALKGAKQALSLGIIRALSFEFGAGNINSRTFFRDFWNFLTPFGFKIYRICPGGKTLKINNYYENLEFYRGASNYLATLD